MVEAKLIGDKLASVTARNRIMAADTRPVRLPMTSRAAMGDVTAASSTRKAPATLDMIESWVGEAAFQQGIRAIWPATVSAALPPPISSARFRSGRQGYRRSAQQFLDVREFPL